MSSSLAQQKYLARMFDTYNEKIRGKQSSEFDCKFWDIIAITTIDDDQKSSTEAQIQAKVDRKELPLKVPFHIISDPKGPKVGNGGSTMHCLDVLHELYGEAIYDNTVLLINAGGFSKRLPSLSVIGKLFQPFPFGEPLFDALEVILAMYQPFVTRMSCGVLVVCPDALIPFFIDEKSGSDWTFDRPGITAIGHPSDIAVGPGHGVYVLEKQPSNQNLTSNVFMPTCLKVLQKPSISKMHDEGAVLKNENGNDFIYSDSCFAMHPDICRRLVSFYQSEKPLKNEIDAFGDFLPALGLNANDEHTRNINNVTSKGSGLVEMRKKVYQLLKGTPLNLIVLNNSKFYHIGSTKELVHNFCVGQSLRSILGMQRIVGSKLMGKSEAGSINGVLMRSIIDLGSRIHHAAIVEFCHFSCPITVGKNSLVSNCSVTSPSCTDDPITLPDDCLFHTIPVTRENRQQYVTIAFSMNDDVKKESLVGVDYFGVPLLDVLKLFQVNALSAFGSGKHSLWTARIFSAKATMDESFLCTLKSVKALMNGESPLDIHLEDMLSMDDILTVKDYKAILLYRKCLRTSIV